MQKYENKVILRMSIQTDRNLFEATFLFLFTASCFFQIRERRLPKRAEKYSQCIDI